MSPTTAEITWNGWTVPVGFWSDGCTMAPDRLFGTNLRTACIWHDWARRHLVHYGLMAVSEADREFRLFLIHLGAPKCLAWLYWLGSFLLRPFMSGTQPIPTPGWERYLQRQDEHVAT